MAINTINNPNTYVGDLNNLTTSNKSSIVGAVNEVNTDKADKIKTLTQKGPVEWSNIDNTYESGIYSVVSPSNVSSLPAGFPASTKCIMEVVNNADTIIQRITATPSNASPFTIMRTWFNTWGSFTSIISGKIKGYDTTMPQNLEFAYDDVTKRLYMRNGSRVCYVVLTQLV